MWYYALLLLSSATIILIQSTILTWWLIYHLWHWLTLVLACMSYVGFNFYVNCYCTTICILGGWTGRWADRKDGGYRVLLPSRTMTSGTCVPPPHLSILAVSVVIVFPLLFCHYRQEVFVMQLVSFYSEVFEKVCMQILMFMCAYTHGTERCVSWASEG